MSTATERARGPVTLRLAREEDREALRRLAELDSSTVPPAPTMVADLDGELLAAVSVGEGEERRAAAYAMSGSQALVGQRLAHGRRRG